MRSISSPSVERAQGVGCFQTQQMTGGLHLLNPPKPQHKGLEITGLNEKPNSGSTIADILRITDWQERVDDKR